MSPEEFERIKEAEKAHLRALRKLKGAVRTLKRQQNVTRAVTGLTGGFGKLREQESLVEELALETARREARMEMALEAADAKGTLSPEARGAVDSAAHASRLADAAGQAARDEADLEAERARKLVAEMKVQMGVPGGDVPTASKTLGRSSSQPSGADDAEASEAPSAPLAVPTETNPPAGSLPEKTIGRRRR